MSVIETSLSYDYFKTLYLDTSLTRDEIMGLCGMGNSRFRNWEKTVVEEEGLKRFSKDGSVQLLPLHLFPQKHSLNDEEDYKGFKKDYLDCELSKTEIMNKYNIKEWKYTKWRLRVKRETGYSRKYGNHKTISLVKE